MLWCAGLPLTGERHLDRSEEEQLRQIAWHLLWRGLSTFVGAAVFGTGLIVGAAELDKYWGGSMVVITVLFIVLLLSLPAILFAREGWTQRGILTFRDLHHGYVRVFEGELTEADLLKTEEDADVTQHRLISLGLLTLDNAQLQTIEVLPVSRRVWRVGDRAVTQWTEARWREVSAAPDTVSPWLHKGSPLTSEGGQSRCLSAQEGVELRREARRQWLGPLVVALLMTAWFLVIVVLALVTGGVPRAGSWWGMIHIVLAAFAADTYFLSRWAQAKKLYRDVRGNEVRVEVGVGSPGSDQLALPTETLPNSGRLWRQAGRPAAWRRIGR